MKIREELAAAVKAKREADAEAAKNKTANADLNNNETTTSENETKSSDALPVTDEEKPSVIDLPLTQNEPDDETNEKTHETSFHDNTEL